MKTILFVDHGQGIGGAETLMLAIIQNLGPDLWQAHVACAPGPLAAAVTEKGIPVHLLPLPRLRRSPRFPWDWQKSARSLAKLASDIDAAVLHANTVRGALYAAAAARLAGRPLLWHMHDFWLAEAEPSHKSWDRRGKQLLCSAATAVVAISQAVADQLPCQSKTTVVHNGVEVSQFEKDTDGQAFRLRFGIPIDAPLAGMVGRLRPWKGQEAFLRTAERIHQVLPTAWFVVVGGDPFAIRDDYQQHLQQMATDLGIGQQLIFTGQISDVQSALAAMDVFVHPGQPEPFGLVNIEAMAMAKPVVAFAHGALPEIVVDGKTGLLVSSGDEQGLGQAITGLLDQPQLAGALGNAGRAQVEQHFTIQQTVRGIERVYGQILNYEV